MSWGYENSYISFIDGEILNLTAQVEGVFKSLSEKGLGDIFRAAVMDGCIGMGAIDALSPEIAADLREIFNASSMAEMAPGVLMWGGPSNVRVRTSDYPQGRTVRAQVIKKLFNKAGANGNGLACALRADFGKLAALLERIDMLKKERRFLGAGALKIA
jgi:hypothetical protein